MRSSPVVPLFVLTAAPRTSSRLHSAIETVSPTPAFRSFAEILAERAAARPEMVVFRFLGDGETETASLTFAELHRGALRVAAALRQECGPGDRALLLFAPGLEFITAMFGCLQAGVIAVPAYPPRLERLVQSLQHLGNIANDCGPAVVLTGGEPADMMRQACSGLEPLASARWINVDRLDGAVPEFAPAATELALLQYTSGSTGDPKGVMITHANLLHNERMLQEALCHHDYLECGTGVSWLPPYHDMGLIGSILLTVYIGASCVLLSPLHFLQRPMRWLQAISHYRANTSGGPTFAYEACVQRCRPEEIADLDLHNWSIAVVGAEPIRAATLERFAATFERCNFHRETFYPSYGLAEGTLFVTGGAKAAAPVLHDPVACSPSAASNREVPRPVGCGHAWLDQTIEIVDPETLRRVPPGQTGEIWVSGPSVAAGYWNRPELTQATFRAMLRDTGHGPYLRTGDLGFVSGNELFVTGRLKELIIVRGRNHAPHEIEATIQQAHPALRPDAGAAFSVEIDGEERVVAVQEVDRRTRELDVRRLTHEVRTAVARQHDLALYDLVLLKPATIPKTTSGKIRRTACRDAYLQQTLPRWTPRSP